MATETRNPFFSFPHPINASVARSVAAGVVVMAVVTIAFDVPWLIFVIAYGFIARVLAGPRISPLALLATRVIVPRLRLPYDPVPGPPKRFAAAMGVGFSVTALILEFGFGYTTAAYSVLGMLIFAAGLESVLGFCLGCRVFAILMKTGIIPESVCEECADWTVRAKRLKRDAAEREAREVAGVSG